MTPDRQHLETWLRNRWHFDWREFWPGGGLVIEVAIGPLDISCLPWYADGATRLIGVEPNPELAAKARLALPDAAIVEAAIGPAAGRAELVLGGGSSHLAGNWAPTPGGGARVAVDVITFDQIDPGDADLVNIDCEGAEWDVLAAMRSRPAVLGIELWPGYPRRRQCIELLCGWGYRLIATSGPEGETMVWRKEGAR